MIHYYYNQSGVIGMNILDEDYIFMKDAFGNVTEILSSDGIVFAKYIYDAWGNTIYKAGALADINPFRYRGYYCDTETGYYYLQTRYYDPAVRRFINADSYELIPQLANNIGELNMYSYCNNNPVMYTDPTGQSVLIGMLITAIVVGALVGGCTAGYSAYKEGRNWGEIAASFGAGAIMGGAMGAVFVLGGAVGAGTIAGWAAVGMGALSLGIGVAAGMGSYALEYGVHSDKSLSGRGFALAGLNGALQAGVTFGAGVIGGKLGLFNKLTHANPLDYYIQQITTNGGLTAMQSVGYGLTVLGGQSFARFALVGAVAAGSRYFINTIAGWYY